MSLISSVASAFSRGKSKEKVETQERFETQWKDLDGRPLYSDDICREMSAFFDEKASERLYQELEWRLCMNFKEGNQYVEINMQTGVIEETPRLTWFQEMEALNNIAPIVETRLAKLGRLKLTFKTRPASNDSEDIASARVSNKVLDGTVQDKRIPQLQNQANAWAEVIGSAVWCSYWDPRAGAIIGQLENDGRVENIYEGDLHVDIATPFEFYLDSLWISNLQDQPRVMRARPMDVDVIEAVYGKKVNGGEVTIYSLSGSGFSHGGSYQKGGSATFGVRKLKNAALVMEFHEKPSPQFPKGRVCIGTKDCLFTATDMQYEVGENGELGYPFEVQKCIEVEGQAWGKSIVSRLIPVQRRYNAIKNRKAEYLARAAIGNMYYVTGTIVNSDKFDVQGLAPGEMLELEPGTNMPPGYLQYPPLPSTFNEEEQSYLNLFVLISGVSEVSRDSSAPTGVSSGTALQILQEQDDTRVGLTADNIRLTMLANGKKWIRLFRQYARTERLVKSVGRDSGQDVIEWRGADLTSDDIYMESIGLLSETLAQRRQMVFDLVQTGLFNDPETGALSKEGRAKIFELIELGDWEHFADSDNSSLHFDRAQRENRKLQQGEDVRVLDFDDDILHISRHNAFRLSSEYDEMLDKDPETAMLFDSHVAEHLASLQEKAMAAQPPQGMAVPQPQGGAPDEVQAV